MGKDCSKGTESEAKRDLPEGGAARGFAPPE